jgi:hypothetical protein
VDNLFEKIEGFKTNKDFKKKSNINIGYDASMMVSLYDFQLKKLENIIDEGVKYYKHQLLKHKQTINIEYNNYFINSIFQYYNDFKNKKYCFDATKLLISEFIKNEVNNIKPLDFQEQYPIINKKQFSHIVSTINEDKINKIRQQKREYYSRNKNKYKEYQKENNDNIKEYQKKYRNRNK